MKKKLEKIRFAIDIGSCSILKNKQAYPQKVIAKVWLKEHF